MNFQSFLNDRTILFGILSFLYCINYFQFLSYTCAVRMINLLVSSSQETHTWRYSDYFLSRPTKLIHIWVRFLAGARKYPRQHHVQPALRPTQPPVKWVLGALSLVVKRPRCEADHSPPSSVEVKNAWSYTLTPIYAFMAWCIVKHRNNFTFTLRFPIYCLKRYFSL